MEISRGNSQFRLTAFYEDFAEDNAICTNLQEMAEYRHSLMMNNLTKAVERLRKKSKSQSRMYELTTPEREHPIAKDSSFYVDATGRLESYDQIVEDKKRHVAVWCKDPGLRDMSHKFPRTFEDMHSSINRFQVLRDLEETNTSSDMKVDASLKTRSQGETKAGRSEAQRLKLPAPIKISAKQINHAFFYSRYTRERIRALNKDEHKAAKDTLASMSTKRTEASQAKANKELDPVG
ncbi:hypothetical protein BGZ73_000823 [Actinomortierella ambigua]|nr:hypothetical protein BGZ73_000823 [Actinomortierella ambigua]